ncbi:MAG: hypothetical protein LBR66_03670 [Candidatus Symbiothrix sp.]|jgi:hypothetical protein|nr:hypothetical protein [Candidatus Symbiothrix sp.]
MKEETVKQLIERYWQGETTLEEERRLRAFFAADNLPAEFCAYRALFAWEKQQHSLRPRRQWTFPQSAWRTYSYSAMKIAASVLLLLAFGMGFYTHYQQERAIDRMISEKPVQPTDSLLTKGNVMAKVSSPAWQEKKIETDSILYKIKETNNY